MADLEPKKRGRDELEEPELDTDSPEVKRLRADLLDSLDDDDDAQFCTTSHDLDSFMKSFEVEITASPSAVGGHAAKVVDLDSDSGEPQPDLGYLLEASDDELGLPPTASYPGGLENDFRSELVRIDSYTSELGGEFWEIPDYDSFGFGFGETEVACDGGDGEYVALGGLFDHSDMVFGSGDVAWRPETLPA